MREGTHYLKTNKISSEDICFPPEKISAFVYINIFIGLSKNRPLPEKIFPFV
ncbi:hypothetical protein JCM10003_3332 [Bacteroides pyogenes JCM 10003]|nr:hypothetical protein JCM10003_3332 [Bacteroides pyogenes JCM 10003]